MSDSKNKEQARKRATVVFAVRSGQITAEEGSRQLGISRKTYYEWEQRALAAMTGVMENREPGRPRSPKDKEKERMQEEIAELRKQLFVAQKTAEVRDMLHAWELNNAGAKKGTGASLEKKRNKKRRP